MRRVDFSTVINVIIENCRENMHIKKNRERAYSQFDLVCDVFFDFYTECDEACFDNSSVSRWIKGNRPVPATIVNYYRENDAESIGDYFQENCLEIVFDKVKLFKALSMCDEKSNPVLFANINMNLGILYVENKETERGLEFMGKAYLFIKLCRAYNDDFITIARNYASTLCEI